MHTQAATYTLPVTPAQLTTLLKQKSRKCFSVLYDCYAPILFGAICRIVKDNHVAEDILQDTFIKIWRKIDLYDTGKGALYTWMLNIANHNCFDYLRSKHQMQRAKNVANGYEACETLTSCITANYTLVKAELRLLIKQLEIKYSVVIEMVYLKEYTHQETAVILNVPLGTVKTRVRIALKQLRVLYELTTV